MGGYLAVLRCSSDDLPVRLFASRDEAVEFAEGLDEHDIGELLSDNIFDTDVSEEDALGVDLVHFSLGGSVLDCESVRDL